MPDFIFIRKSRNLVSTFLHVLLNLSLGLVSIFLTVVTSSWLFGVLLVFISKWRTFAVRPHYLSANIRANLVDFIVGVSFVFIAYASGSQLLPIHFILAISYILWLIALKPLSTMLATDIQAMVALFLGSTASTILLAGYNPIFFVLSIYIVGYAASNHIVSRSEDKDYELLPPIFGLLCSQIAWLSYNWLIIYSFPTSGIIIPQSTILLCLFAFFIGSSYRLSLQHPDKLPLKKISTPAIFCLITSLIIIIFFSKPIFNF